MTGFGGMHLYTKRPDFFEVKKVDFGLTFGACTIASVSYTGACGGAWAYGKKTMELGTLITLPPVGLFTF